MKYRVVNAAIQNDGSVIEGKRHHIILWPCELKVGGLYFLAGGRMGGTKLYRVLEVVQ